MHPRFGQAKTGPHQGPEQESPVGLLIVFCFKHNAVKHSPQCNQVNVPKSHPVL